MPSSVSQFPISWFGNKRGEVEEIVPFCNFEGKKIIIEPFCGTSAMSFEIWKQYGDKFKYILNDKDNELIKIYRYLIDNDIEEMEKEINAIRKQITTPEIFNDYKKNKCDDTAVVITLNLKTLDLKKRKLKSYAEKQYKFSKKQLEFIDFIKSPCVEVLDKDWKDIFDVYKDNPEALFLFDPPYIKSYNKSFAFENLSVYEYFREKKEYKSSIYFTLEEIPEITEIFGEPLNKYEKYYSTTRRFKTHAIYLY